MKKLLIILILLGLAPVGPGWVLGTGAYADRLADSSGNVLYTNPAQSGGGSQNVNPYTLQFSVGDPLAGKATTGASNLQFWILWGGQAPVVSTADDGLVQNTQIFRVTNILNSFLKLTWKYKDGSGITSADIWSVKLPAGKPEGDYAEASTGWTKIGSVSGTEFIDNATGAPQANDNQNVYYRVVPVNLAKANLFDLAQNARTVAKIDLRMPANGLQLVSVPVYVGAIDAALSGQVGNDGFYFYPQSGTGLGAYKYENDKLSGTPFVLQPGVGFWLENLTTNAHTISFVGSLETSATRKIAAIDLTGNTLPYSILSANLIAFDGDYVYPQSGTGLGAYKYSVDKWQGTFTLGNTAGLWYEHTGNRSWKTDLKTGLSILNQ